MSRRGHHAQLRQGNVVRSWFAAAGRFDDRSARPRRSAAPIAIVTGGSVTLAGGIAMGAVAFAHARDAYARSDESRAARRLAIGADVTMFSGGAALLAGVLVGVLGGRNDDEPSVAVVPRIGRNPGIDLVGRF